MPKGLSFWIALSWSGFIAYFCLTPASNLPSISVAYVDKFVHACFHFVFTLSWFLFLKKQINSSNITKSLWLSYGLSVFFGIGIEILQEYCTTTRRGDVLDVLANMTGATLAACVILILRRYNRLDKI